MRDFSLSSVICPACRVPLGPVSLEESNGGLERGALFCADCRVGVPVLHGFPLFGEQMLGEPSNLAEELDEIDRRLFGPALDYEVFLQRKRQRPGGDLYAAFRPFNESSRAFLPFVSLVRERLNPGDLLLDLWCRTGWTGELLAATFPDQRVISVWESGSDVLGYRGFRSWLGSERRLPNWDLVFHHSDHPLPFATNGFALVHGLDTLHRYRHQPLISECLRVSRADAMIVFPHVHLTNSEPEPFFERGETQLHGTRYRSYFSRLLDNTPRSALVLSEKRMFEEHRGVALVDEAETEHYNGCIALIRDSDVGRVVAEETKSVETHSQAYAIPNALLEFDLSGGRVQIDESGLFDGAREMLDRHPVYERRLRHSLPRNLSDREQLILYWVFRLKTVTEIAETLSLTSVEVLEVLLDLEEAEVVQVQNVSFAMAQLQHYYASQRVIPEDEEMTLVSLWEKGVALSSDRTYLEWAEDGSIFSYGDTDRIARRVAGFLRDEGVQPGDRVFLHAGAHPEFFFGFWGCVLAGAVAVPVSTALSTDHLRRVLDATRPKLGLVQVRKLQEAGLEVSFPVFAFAEPGDSESVGEDRGVPSFLDRVADRSEQANLPLVEPDHPAAILFTSGSTGGPKGVVLNHGCLYRSSELFDWVYRWRSSDRFLSSGSPHTMSGLRNSCLTSLHSGACVVLAGDGSVAAPLGILTTCISRGVTLLNATPAFLSYCVQLAEKLHRLGSPSLRMVLCTGATLHRGLRDGFEGVMKCPVYDYYGLTESSGGCIFVSERESGVDEPGIGRPYGAIARVVGEDGVAVKPGEVGELYLYSDSLSEGYVDGDDIRANPNLRAGFLATGDLVRRGSDGCFTLVGRRDRMLVDRNGENVFPEEIERILDRQDGVIECHVTSYREGNVDEIGALIVPEPSIGDRTRWVQELRESLRQGLAGAQVPARLIVVDEVPVGPSGKWDLDGVRRLFSSNSGPSEDRVTGALN